MPDYPQDIDNDIVIPGLRPVSGAGPMHFLLEPHACTLVGFLRRKLPVIVVWLGFPHTSLDSDASEPQACSLDVFSDRSDNP